MPFGHVKEMKPITRYQKVALLPKWLIAKAIMRASTAA
jgi:hypothetical protein